MAIEPPFRTVVLDASVGLKWIIWEPDSDLARQLAKGRKVIVPSFFWIEIGNVLATMVRRGEFDAAGAQAAFRDLAAAPLTTVTLDTGAVAAALDISLRLSHPIYDCTYLALAEAEDAFVVTADRRFLAAVKRHGAAADRVKLLSDI